MKWKQFLTPVQSVNGQEARALKDQYRDTDILYLDVRQPKEYKESHLPGAKLIPIGDLDKHLDDLDSDQPTVVYCAVGGRSRVAAQLLAGKGFTKIYNLTGGIKAWDKITAFGPEDQGMAMFSGTESAEESILIAYGLEEGLRDFYLLMQTKTTETDARKLFAKLADIEVIHQEQLLELYKEITGEQVTNDNFANSVVSPILEGGLTTEEYLARFQLDPDSITDILSIAMAIEAQALDLYQRASFNAQDAKTKEALQHIADEERQHLQYLADYMDRKTG
ncbi:rhodanese-like domain-containing protein [Desulfovibrio sp. UCD-KL4C]|uniref:rhodanese-like domain-containing protein n=1 Tax=Desulfovibrio sp. UCD-KL4C TaxID=2578120 RepID=UPI0025C4C98B|nr:rhodanese-like domain-containing protein [Desulfovibrio sp. UCD-KL4C]